jgi:hypothetical protein
MIRRTLLGLTLMGLAAFPALAQSSHHVRGYTRSNGTYVAPHYQTNADSSRTNNWSSRGNVNPYTGKVGTVDPYRSNTSGSLSSTRPLPTQPSSIADGEDPQ